MKSEKDVSLEEQIRRAETIISMVLLIGVLVSSFLIVMGFIVTLSHDHILLKGSYKTIIDKKYQFPHSVSSVIKGIGQFNGISITLLGLLCLILTPIFRVGASLITFLMSKDINFIFITAFVLFVLLISFFIV